ncbi:hypothetical protein PI739_02935 [Pseudomonas cerasi]|uniref:hypothetical protein n=1 Tax=Pseudomonas cerasi TaxID=1583341 RepID=UPI0022FFE741|nr:hypothetical protein [Pseudomonas cerasi]MDA7011306.1 hypothetical protein [Pseudomonas cerasi]
MNIEQQIQDMLQKLDMVRPTEWDGITPQVIIPVVGNAKDKAIDEILQQLWYHYQSNSPTSNGEKNDRT